MIAGNEPTQLADDMAAAGMFGFDQLFCAAKDLGAVQLSERGDLQ